MRNVDKYPELPAEDEEFFGAFRELLKEANGFVYAGDRAEGIAAAIRVLRSRQDLVGKLLTTSQE